MKKASGDENVFLGTFLFPRKGIISITAHNIFVHVQRCDLLPLRKELAKLPTLRSPGDLQQPKPISQRLRRLGGPRRRPAGSSNGRIVADFGPIAGTVSLSSEKVEANTLDCLRLASQRFLQAQSKIRSVRAICKH